MHKIYFSFLLLCSIISCNLYAQPTITSFSPTSGPVGTTVTITGTNFNSTPSNNVVYFGATQAVVNSATSTNLNVTVPPSATFQNITVTDTITRLTAYSNKPFIITFPCGGVINSNSFSAKTEYTTSVSGLPYASICDFDGDAKPELIATNVIANTISIYQNTSTSGNINFSARQDLITGTGPRDFTTGDFDNDGKIDIAVVNVTSQSISLFINTSSLGLISFAPKIDLNIGTVSFYIENYDLDSDGKTDLVISNQNLNTISVLKNTSSAGFINFAPKIDYTSGSAPVGIAISDLDNDGKAEIVVANYSSNNISIYKNISNIGSISFNPKIDLTTGTNPNEVAVGDFNNDGLPDIVSSNFVGQSCSIFKNTGTVGTISFNPKVDIAIGMTCNNIKINDIDGDSKLDIITGSTTVSILKNISSAGTIIFNPKVDFIAGGTANKLAIGDLDGDTKPDIIHPISYIKNQTNSIYMTSASSMTICNGASVNLSLNSSSIGSNYSWIANDNPNTTGESITAQTTSLINDILVNNSSSVQTIIYTVTPTATTSCGLGSSQTITITLMPTSIITSNNQATIWSGGNFLMSLTSNVPSNYSWGAIDNINTIGESIATQTLNIINNTITNLSGTPQLVNYTVTPIPIGSCTTAITQTISVTIDFPHPYITFKPSSGPVGTTVTIYGSSFDTLSTNNSVFFGATKAAVLFSNKDSLLVSVPYGATYKNITVADMNSNLISRSAKPFIVTYFCNGSLDSTSFAPKADFVTGSHPTDIPVYDFDVDSRSDFAIPNSISTINTVSILKNLSSIGTSSFTPPAAFSTGSYPTDISIGDMNGDGKYDVMTSNKFDGSFSLLKNTCTTSTVSFAPKVNYTGLPNPYSISNMDIDGDGKSDVAISNRYTIGTISVIRNLSSVNTVSFAPKIDFIVGADPTGISIDDIDGDLKPDIIVANRGSNDVSVLRNTSTIGNISFATSLNFSVGNLPVKVLTGDIDNDGKLDLAVPNYTSNSISILRNTSTPGNISFAPKIDFITGSSPLDLAITDLDGDAMLDIVVANYYAQYFSFYKNLSSSGNIYLAPKKDFNVGTQVQAISIADMNSDGLPDINLLSETFQKVSVYKMTQCIPTNIQTNNVTIDEVNIYPNPFADKTTISFNYEQKKTSIRILDAVGKELKNIEFTGFNLDLEKSNLNAGIYFIQIIAKNKQVINKKIIIQ